MSERGEKERNRRSPLLFFSPPPGAGALFRSYHCTCAAFLFSFPIFSLLPRPARLAPPRLSILRGIHRERYREGWRDHTPKEQGDATICLVGAETPTEKRKSNSPCVYPLKPAYTFSCFTFLGFSLSHTHTRTHAQHTATASEYSGIFPLPPRGNQDRRGGGQPKNNNTIIGYQYHKPPSDFTH